jgi:hypothetical protein
MLVAPTMVLGRNFLLLTKASECHLGGIEPGLHILRWPLFTPQVSGAVGVSCQISLL